MRKYTGSQLKRFAALEPRSPIQVGSRSPEEIVTEVQVHEGIPIKERLAVKLGINKTVFRAIVAGNTTVRQAWHEKVTHEVGKLPLSGLFDSKIAKLYKDVPTAVERRMHRILEFTSPTLSAFNGRLTFQDLARHIAPEVKCKDVAFLLSKDPILRAAVEARFREILTNTDAREIKRRALHRDVAAISAELKQFALDKLTAAGISVKVGGVGRLR
ncbi:MAG: hypothetical protein Q8R15_03835 [Candidatus Micrarchaeota archaeon]|nr:hypothetical protein [Candidatus Micrarchaeota archaeon]